MSARISSNLTSVALALAARCYDAARERYTSSINRPSRCAPAPALRPRVRRAASPLLSAVTRPSTQVSLFILARASKRRARFLRPHTTGAPSPLPMRLPRAHAHTLQRLPKQPTHPAHARTPRATAPPFRRSLIRACILSLRELSAPTHPQAAGDGEGKEGEEGEEGRRHSLGAAHGSARLGTCGVT